eukprot:jgi/Tetstr1/421972/TSEL_001218.t1
MLQRSSPSDEEQKAGLIFAPRNQSQPDEGSDPSKPSPNAGPSTRFRKAARNVQTAQAVSRSFVPESLTKLDAYAQEVEPPSKVGGLVSLVVILATAAYCVYLVYLFITRPLVVTNNIEWFQDAGPFPMAVTCVTTSGCFVSNDVNASWTHAELGAEQAECRLLAYRETFVFNMTYTQWPRDGFVAMYLPNNTSAETPPGYGYLTRSETQCSSGPMCMQGVMPMYVPSGPGLSLANYVRTVNTTRTDASKLRNEWFVTEVDGRASQVDPNMPCAARALAAQGDGLVQSRIEPQPYFNVITVSRDSSWFSLWGTFGGAYELFLEIGGLVLASAGLLSVLERLWARLSGRTIAAQPGEGSADSA